VVKRGGDYFGRFFIETLLVFFDVDQCQQEKGNVSKGKKDEAGSKVVIANKVKQSR